MLHIPFYNPDKSYQDNYAHGPYGDMASPQTFERSGEPSEDFMGHKVWQAFGIPAGPLVNGRYVAQAFKMGFDVNVFKTVRTRAYECHPWPNVLGVKIDGDLTLDKANGQLVAENKYAKPLSITNSFGVPSPDPDTWQTDMKTTVDQTPVGQVMIGSFQGTKDGSGNVQAFVDDYVLGARLVKETGAKILEANLSCPNEGTADLLCFDTQGVLRIADAIKQEIGDTPLILKLAYFQDEAHLKDFIQKLGSIADGFSVINTIPATIVTPSGEQALPGEGRARSGVCGAGIKWAGLDMVSRLSKLRQELDAKFSIIGVGGVTEPEDYVAFKDRGADCVMSATGAMWNPYLGQEIWEMNSYK